MQLWLFIIILLTLIFVLWHTVDNYAKKMSALVKITSDDVIKSSGQAFRHLS